jgi:dephospho-CoA kinase
MDNDEYVHRKICLHFGMESYVDGKLNTAYLSDIVFNDKDKLAVLENIVHPRVFLKFREIAKCSCMDQMLVLESAILFDVGWNKFCDKVIWVDAGFHVRKKRVMDRDGISFEDVKGKFFSQANGKVYVADHVVDNNNDSRYIDLSFMEKYV